MIDKAVLKNETDLFLEKIDLSYTQDDEQGILDALDRLMKSIPDKRRRSYGIVSVIAAFCKAINNEIPQSSFEIGFRVYSKSTDFRTVSLGLGLVSHAGIEEPIKVLPILADAANHDIWEVKEFVQMFIRKITKVHKTTVQDFLMDLTQSENPNLRRFASEALRPVVENKWIHEEPDFSLKVLRKLFRETEEFPKVSVGNNLSDLSRKNPQLILNVVKELKSLNNEHSDFIAHRACRNLIKDYPLEVMNLLGVEEYKYKKSRYSKKDFE